MKLIRYIKNLFIKKVDINITNLPSRGMFYNDNFKIAIKKAELDDIEEYEDDYDNDDMSLILYKLKKIVEKNIILSSGYNFKYIKSIDVVYLFLEIVKLTKNKQIKIEYYDDKTSKKAFINFSSENFNYFDISDDLFDTWDKNERIFNINNYKFSLPSIGVENSLTKYLTEKSYDSDAIKYNDYNYNFTFFIGHKEYLTYDEIDNLIHIFNFDIDDEERKKINNIVKIFLPMQRYTLKYGNKIIEMGAKINLEDIWK